jgi:hypothetical protein
VRHTTSRCSWSGSLNTFRLRQPPNSHRADASYRLRFGIVGDQLLSSAVPSFVLSHHQERSTSGHAATWAMRTRLVGLRRRGVGVTAPQRRAKAAPINEPLPLHTITVTPCVAFVCDPLSPTSRMIVTCALGDGHAEWWSAPGDKGSAASTPQQPHPPTRRRPRPNTARARRKTSLKD